jgi:hypothetical protein
MQSLTFVGYKLLIINLLILQLCLLHLLILHLFIIPHLQYSTGIFFNIVILFCPFLFCIYQIYPG